MTTVKTLARAATDTVCVAVTTKKVQLDRARSNHKLNKRVAKNMAARKVATKRSEKAQARADAHAAEIRKAFTDALISAGITVTTEEEKGE